MNVLRPFDPEFWIEYDHEPSNVIHLNTPHARANAAQAAQLVEADRSALRIEELLHERKRLEDRIFDIDYELQEINDNLRAPTVITGEER